MLKVETDIDNADVDIDSDNAIDINVDFNNTILIVTLSFDNALDVQVENDINIGYLKRPPAQRHTAPLQCSAAIVWKSSVPEMLQIPQEQC